MMRPFFDSVVGAIRSSATARGSDVRLVRANTRASLAEHRTARREQTQALRRTLKAQRAAAIRSVRAMLAPGGASQTTIPTTRGPEREAGRSERAGVWELWSEPVSEPDPAVELLRAEVLQAVQAHPQGIRAVDLGNEIGVDWRWVLGVAAGLIEDGLLEQIEEEFYPIAKASRRRW